MMMVDNYCRGCIYHGEGNSVWRWGTCNYILIEKRRRGCPSGKECTKRKFGEDVTISVFHEEVPIKKARKHNKEAKTT